VTAVQFSPDLRDPVLDGSVTLTYRLWTRPKVKVGGRYAVGPGWIEVDDIDLVPFASVTAGDLRRCGESDREPCDTGPRTPAPSPTTPSSTASSSTPSPTDESGGVGGS
jgi:hypothetical protein